MAQSLAKLLAHIVFSTKQREPWLHRDIRPRMFSYMGGVLRSMESSAIEIGGEADHVHVLCTLPRTVAPCRVVEELKKSTSKWLKPIDPSLRSFYWQNGYGMFSVRPSQVEGVRNYIRNQEDHHHKMTFQEELRQFFDKHELEYDERYVWD